MRVCVCFFFLDFYRYNNWSLNFIPQNPKIILVFTSRPSLGAREGQASTTNAATSATLSPPPSQLHSSSACGSPGQRRSLSPASRRWVSSSTRPNQASPSRLCCIAVCNRPSRGPLVSKVDLSFSSDVMCPFATMSACVPPSLPRPEVLPSSSASLPYAHTTLKPLENVWES